MNQETTPAPSRNKLIPARRSRHRKRWIIALIALAALYGGYRVFKRPKPDDIKFATVTRQDIEQTVSATGSVTLQTGAEVKIGAEVSGKVKRLYVDVGDQVRKGQLIVELVNPESDSALRQAGASVTAAEARFRQATESALQQLPQTDAEIARASAAVRSAESRVRQADLLEKTTVVTSRSDIERAQSSLANAQEALRQITASTEQRIESARANVEQAQAELDRAASEARRAETLLKKGYVSESAAESATTAERVASSQLTSSRKSLDATIADSRREVSAAQNALKAAQTELASVKASASQVEVRNAEAESARADLASAREALVIATAARRQNAIRSAVVAEARASMVQARAEYQRQLSNYDKMRIYAPIDGVVLSVDTKEGETVTAGFQTPNLLTIANLRRVEVEVPVDETDIGKIHIGQSATVKADAFPDRSMKARVVKVASGATVDQNVVTYKATVALDEPVGILKPRMTATVEVQTGRVKNALCVPMDAVKLANDKDVVYCPPAATKGKPGRFVEVPVKTGASDDKVIQIISGLKEGEKIVLSSRRLDMQRKQGGS